MARSPHRRKRSCGALGRRRDRAKPWPEWDAYKEALGAWEEDTARIEVESGKAAAEERANETSEAVLDIRDKIVATRATTLAGLVFKARYAAEHYPGEWDQEVMVSIVDDLLAMGGAELAS